MRRNCQRHNVEGIPQNQLTQLQHPWYLSDFTIYLPNMSTQVDANKNCVPNDVTWKIPSEKHCSLNSRVKGNPNKKDFVQKIILRRFLNLPVSLLESVWSPAMLSSPI
jgi:hypothetical protein